MVTYNMSKDWIVTHVSLNTANGGVWVHGVNLNHEPGDKDRTFFWALQFDFGKNSRYDVSAAVWDPGTRRPTVEMETV